MGIEFDGKLQSRPVYFSLRNPCSHTDGLSTLIAASHHLDQLPGYHQANAVSSQHQILVRDDPTAEINAIFSGDSPTPTVFDTHAYAFRSAGAFTSTVPCSRLYLIALESKLIRTCFTRIRSALTHQVLIEWNKIYTNVAFFCLRFDHG